MNSDERRELGTVIFATFVLIATILVLTTVVADF
jgi:hypothetical protein